MVGTPWNLPPNKAQTWDILRKHASYAKSICIWQKWEPKHSTEGVFSWFRVLDQLVKGNIPEKFGKPMAFWKYYQNADQQAESGKRIGFPWLWKKEEGSDKRKFTPVPVLDPFFSDEHDRHCRLVNAAEAERERQCLAITSIFCATRVHQATFERIKNSSNVFAHVKIGKAKNDEPEICPELTETTLVKFSICRDGEVAHESIEAQLNLKGNVITYIGSTDADFVMLVSNMGDNFDPQKVYDIRTEVEPNLMPIDAQIHALRDAGYTTVHGDRSENRGQGFSLRKTILAQGMELDPTSEDYFELNMRKISTVPLAEQEVRLGHILSRFRLDEAQREAFDKSISKVCAGVHLIQGPPGTGKTRVALVIILALASLDIKVLLAAGSNKGVDNLAAAVAEALKADAKLAGWCGQLVRFRTPGYQMAVLRKNSSSRRTIRKEKGTLSSLEKQLEPYQLHNLITTNTADANGPKRDKFLALLANDRQQGLSTEGTKRLKRLHQDLSHAVFQSCKMVATTLSNASNEVFRVDEPFKPVVLVCDDSGQCTEGDHMIAMTIPSLRAFVLLGDHCQLKPTVISANTDNEGAEFLKRSLMERLFEAEYPSSRLKFNYRSHPEIMDFYNQAVYDGELTAAPITSGPQGYPQGREERLQTPPAAPTQSREGLATRESELPRRDATSSKRRRESSDDSERENELRRNLLRIKIERLRAEEELAEEELRQYRWRRDDN